MGFATNKTQQINQLASYPSLPLSLPPSLPSPLFLHLAETWNQNGKNIPSKQSFTLDYYSLDLCTPCPEQAASLPSLPCNRKCICLVMAKERHSPDQWRRTALVTAQWSNAWLAVCHILGQELCPTRYKCRVTLTDCSVLLQLGNVLQ